MLNDRQWERLLSKLVRFESTLERLIFEKVDSISEAGSVKKYESLTPHYDVPDDSLFSPCEAGSEWGEEYGYCWFKCEYKIPENLNGKAVYVYPKTNAYETLLFVNGKPFGTFCSKIVVTGHGNHYCGMLVNKAEAGSVVEIALDCYAGHYVKGCMPFEESALKSFRYKFESIDICIKNEKVQSFLFDLKTLNQAARALDKKSFRRADILNTLEKVHEILYYDLSCVDRDTFFAAIDEAAELLTEKLSYANSKTAPYAGLIGHSHMDTAWLWHIDETIKKCARTYSNQISLMEQYEEYKFVQSSAYHGDMIRKHYPQLFEDIKKKTAEGRYEPNGGVWIECDCNITGGEAMVRQFIWGQLFTRKHFNYTSDSFWLPDTFGYSASIPQIMKGCGVDYFLTTKMAWNDTTVFPYDTFYWRGIDGTKVLTHLNKTHIWPDAENLAEYVYGVRGNDNIKEKTVSNMRLLSYGFGDGGGGPQFEMIEMSRRVKDFEGLPKSEHTTVSDFMKKLEKTVVEPSVYSGELYLELHRGTLTNQHTIKRNNRLAEIALHNLELATVISAVNNSETAEDTNIRPLLCTTLVNQFHDILPGTCIPRVHEQTRKEMAEVIETANNLAKEALDAQENKKMISILNPVSFDRSDIVYIDAKYGALAGDDYKQQIFTDLQGNKKIAVLGVAVKGFESTAIELTDSFNEQSSVFKSDGNMLVTPYATVEFDERGFIKSFVDTESGRELCGEGYALNTFLMAEDVPSAWDNWDIDADSELKYKDTNVLLSREIVSDGAVEYRIRSEYRISPKSTIKQDMVFFANSKEVRFETVMDWNDDHRLLKTSFDTTILSDTAKHEMQFGYIKRPTTRSTNEEKAKFEVVNHKYTDLSDYRTGVAVLNDCKYGVSVKDSQIRPTLHKGGLRPDFNGDKGIHECTYSFLPHGAFSAESVVKPAYLLNYKPIIIDGVFESEPLASVNSENIIIETVKPCEENQKAYILRIYESEGGYTNTVLRLAHGAKKIEITNMLEETIETLTAQNDINLTFKPFEIKTIKITY